MSRRLLISFICALLFCASSALAESLIGKVVGIADGDTITVLDAQNVQWKIRLTGIDAPEGGQPFGTVSKNRLSQLIFGKTVVVEWQKLDRHKRVLGKVMLGKLDINLQMVLNGMAWHYKAFAKEQSSSGQINYARAEEAARRAKAGLWRDAAPIAPWEWRKNKKSIARAKNSDSCPCGTTEVCTSSQGADYCVNSKGRRRYL